MPRRNRRNRKHKPSSESAIPSDDARQPQDNAQSYGPAQDGESDPIPPSSTCIAVDNVPVPHRKHGANIVTIDSDDESVASTLDGDGEQSESDDAMTKFSSDDEEDYTIDNYERLEDELSAAIEEAKVAASVYERRKSNLSLLRKEYFRFGHSWMTKNAEQGALKEFEAGPELQMLIQAVFNGMDRGILSGIMHGDLPRRARLKEKKKLRRALVRHQTQGTHKEARQPVIYGNFLVNPKHGLAPTYKEMRQILAVMDEYASNTNSEKANEIDNAVGKAGKTTVTMAQSKQGGRKYLSSETNGTGRPSRERTAKLKTFCGALRLRLDTAVDTRPHYDENEHMPDALSEYGYTVTAVERKAQHASHERSNFLMNLTEAAARSLFGYKYTMQFFVVYCMISGALAPLAEALISDLAQCYYEGGGGFSIADDCQSTNSKNTIDDNQAEMHAQWSMKNVNQRKNSTAFQRRSMERERVGDEYLELLREKRMQRCIENAKIDAETLALEAVRDELQRQLKELEKREEEIERQEKELDRQEKERERENAMREFLQ